MGVNAWLIKGFFDTDPERDRRVGEGRRRHATARSSGASSCRSACPVLAVVGLLSFIGTINEFIIASA